MTGRIEVIAQDGVRYGMIVRAGPRTQPIEFFTPDGDSLQVGAFDLPARHAIKPHAHIPCERNLNDTSEVLVIEAGVLQVDFYREDRVLVATRRAHAGDIVILIQGGHGFTVIEAVRMIEVKQGPYAGGGDKVRFEPRVVEAAAPAAKPGSGT